AGDVTVDRRDLDAADGADDLLTVDRVQLRPQPGRVPDEVPGLLLLEEQTLDVLRLVLERRDVDVDDRELRVRELRRHGIHRVSHQEADADRDPGTRADARRQVRDVVGRRLRLNDTTLDAGLLRGQEADVGEVVERLVVQAADVGHETRAERRRPRGRRVVAANRRQDRGDDQRGKSNDPQR